RESGEYSQAGTHNQAGIYPAVPIKFFVFASLGEAWLRVIRRGEAPGRLDDFPEAGVRAFSARTPSVSYWTAIP
ncbi:MAG: hypothetical protein V1816_05405, partial [Pseudomonadota bacterium]